MMTFKGEIIVKKILTYFALILILLTIVACGGGGNSDNGSVGQNPLTSAKTTAILKISLTGSLPANTTIAGADLTLTLPDNVTPANINGTVASGVVTLSGTFSGGTQTPPLYTVATTSTPGTLKVTLINSIPAGVTQVGEVATITLQLSNNVVPTVDRFAISSVNVIDAAIYGTISSMGANVAIVTIQ
jgi:hypothetical protein